MTRIIHIYICPILSHIETSPSVGEVQQVFTSNDTESRKILSRANASGEMGPAL